MTHAFFSKVKAGFSLIEVNMAIFVLAGGALALMGLFPLGLRQSMSAKSEMRQATFAQHFLSSAQVAARDVTTIDQLVSKMQSDFGLTLKRNEPNTERISSAPSYPSSSNSDPNRVFYYAWYVETDASYAMDEDATLKAYDIYIQITTENIAQVKRAFNYAPVYATSVLIHE